MRRALLIGINIYDAQNIPDLQGCVSDVGKMRDLLAHHEDGTPNFSCTTLTTEGNGMVTRAVMREQIRELFGHDADAALLYFSGHGMIDGNRGVLVTQDCVDFDFGVPMTEILEETVRAPIREIIIILDCCHSGDLGGNPVLPSGHAVLKEGVSILTSSRSTQVSYEINGEGVFTSLLCDALNGEAADILGNGCQRVVFNIGGNHYRMICAYGFGDNMIHLFVKWIGTHADYDRICDQQEQYTISQF